MLTAQEARDTMNPEHNPDLKPILLDIEDKIRTSLARGETFIYHDLTHKASSILVPYLNKIGYKTVLCTSGKSSSGYRIEWDK